MIAYHGDAELREWIIARADAHREADDYVRGTYGEIQDGRFRGCAVGCTLHDLGERGEGVVHLDDHARYSEILGVPESLARLQDGIFESLPQEDAPAWPGRFFRAIPLGADLSLVDARLRLAILTAHLHYDRTAHPDVARAVEGVIALLRRRIGGDEPDPTEWSAARSAARSAAWSAARSAARSAAWTRIADTLLALLSSAPVATEATA